MINVDLLKSVKTIVTHEGCADGIASALILKDALPDAEGADVQPVRHRSPASDRVRSSEEAL